MSAGRSTLVLAAAVAFILGAGLMIPFSSMLTRVAGIVSLAVFVVCGLLAIAEPRFLAADGDEEDQP